MQTKLLLATKIIKLKQYHVSELCQFVITILELGKAKPVRGGSAVEISGEREILYGLQPAGKWVDKTRGSLFLYVKRYFLNTLTCLGDTALW